MPGDSGATLHIRASWEPRPSWIAIVSVMVRVTNASLDKGGLVSGSRGGLVMTSFVYHQPQHGIRHLVVGPIYYGVVPCRRAGEGHAP
jgi:hypothetical protein